MSGFNGNSIGTWFRSMIGVERNTNSAAYVWSCSICNTCVYGFAFGCGPDFFTKECPRTTTKVPKSPKKPLLGLSPTSEHDNPHLQQHLMSQWDIDQSQKNLEHCAAWCSSSFPHLSELCPASSHTVLSKSSDCWAIRTMFMDSWSVSFYRTPPKKARTVIDHYIKFLILLVRFYLWIFFEGLQPSPGLSKAPNPSPTDISAASGCHARSAWGLHSTRYNDWWTEHQMNVIWLWGIDGDLLNFNRNLMDIWLYHAICGDCWSQSG
jgi:hypothetical protein